MNSVLMDYVASSLPKLYTSRIEFGGLVDHHPPDWRTSSATGAGPVPPRFCTFTG